MPTWEPYPPPLPHWPDHVKRIYVDNCKWIDECRSQYEADGTLAIPFVCYLCRERRTDFAMLSGDDCPICVRCLGFHPREVL